MKTEWTAKTVQLVSAGQQPQQKPTHHLLRSAMKPTDYFIQTKMEKCLSLIQGDMVDQDDLFKAQELLATALAAMANRRGPQEARKLAHRFPYYFGISERVTP